MLYADWLLLAGSWRRRTIITAGDRAPATNLSVGATDLASQLIRRGRLA
jgi:hypothetical protein